MTLVNMCRDCPHNPIKQTTVVGGAEVVPEWMQHVKNTFWNKPELAEYPEWLLKGLEKTNKLVNVDTSSLETLNTDKSNSSIDIEYKEYTATLTDGKPVPLKEYMETLARYQNKDMLYLIGEIPVEYRPVFEKMFDTLIKRMVEKQITSMPLS